MAHNVGSALYWSIPEKAQIDCHCHLLRASITHAVSYDFSTFPHDFAGKACLTFKVESYQSDICRFEAMTLSLLHLDANWPVLTFIFGVLLLRYNFQCPSLHVQKIFKFRKGSC